MAGWIERKKKEKKSKEKTFSDVAMALSVPMPCKDSLGMTLHRNVNSKKE